MMTNGEKKIVQDVRELIEDIANGAETPGGVEHLGDFRRLVGRWAKHLSDQSVPEEVQAALDEAQALDSLLARWDARGAGFQVFPSGQLKFYSPGATSWRQKTVERRSEETLAEWLARGLRKALGDEQ